MRKVFLVGLFFMPLVGCSCSTPVQSVSGVKMAEAGKIQLDSTNHTVEQANIIERLKQDNSPGSMKHLYVISAYTGQTILYSPVKGKVTSSDKRLSPRQIDSTYGSSSEYPVIQIGGNKYIVKELPGEDGTFGHSAEYLYWFTPDGRYHQHYLGGGQIVHISDQPINVKGVIITIEGGK